MSAKPTYRQLPATLVETVSELQPLYDRDYDPDEDWINTYGFFGTQLVMVIRKLIRHAHTFPEDHDAAYDIIRRIMAFLETVAHSPDTDVLNVLFAGFFEAMWIAGSDYNEITGMFGSQLRTLWDRDEEELGGSAPDEDINIGIYKFIDESLDILRDL